MVAQRAGVLQLFRPMLRNLGNILIPAPSSETVVTLPFGMKMVTPPGFRGIRSYVTGVYEEDLTALFKDIVNEGMIVVDLGALLGIYTLLASLLVGTSGKVYAFEPEPKSFAYLLRNIEINNCLNIIAVQKAVSDRTGSAGFILSSDRSIGPIGGLLSVGPHNTGSSMVQTTSLDAFFEEHGWPSIDLIKMDIDGAEKLALDGMKELSRRNPQMQLIMEFDPVRIHGAGGSPEVLAVTLQNLGFRKGYIIERRLKPFLLAHGFLRSSVHYNVVLKKE